MQSVHIYGAGFVGITLAGHFLKVSKYEVFLVEKEVDVIEKIRNANLPVYEPGLKQIIHDGLVSGRLHLQSLDEVTSVYIAFICISTPKNVVQNPIISLAQELIPVLAPRASIFIRSTCVIGSSKELSNILERLNRDDVDVYNAPERTAEGVAMQELIELPQLLGARDDSTLSRGSGILQDLGFEVIVSGSWSEVEMAKLLCNVWRDYSFAFANEAALLGERHFIDVLKVISIANYKYKRAGIPQPGPVGGPCLSKDTYLLVNQEVSSNSLFLHSRELNEHYLEEIVGEILSFAKN